MEQKKILDWLSKALETTGECPEVCLALVHLADKLLHPKSALEARTTARAKSADLPVAPVTESWLSPGAALECADEWPLWERYGWSNSVFTKCQMQERAKQGYGEWRKFCPEGMDANGVIFAGDMSEALLDQCEWYWRSSSEAIWEGVKVAFSRRGGQYTPVKWPAQQLAQDVPSPSAAPTPEAWLSHKTAMDRAQLWPLWEYEGASGVVTSEEVSKSALVGLWRMFRPEGMGADGTILGEHMTDDLIKQCKWKWRATKGFVWVPITGASGTDGIYRPARWPVP